MNSSFRNAGIGQQLALIAAGLCLLVSLALVALGAISSRHMQHQLQQENGQALAELIARRIATAMENGDLLSVSASLRRFVEISPADAVVLTDVEGKALSQAGQTRGGSNRQFVAAVNIESDIAGQVAVTVNTGNAQAALNRFILSLLGLAVLLSLSVYGAGRHFGQRLGNRLARMARSITLEEEDERARPVNEVSLLEKRIDALPMDLLRARTEPAASDEHYETTAVLYLHLTSLVDYVDTLDELALQRYIGRVHQVVYAAAGFYAGDLQVARQFGLAVYFNGDNKAGSAAFRAASCAWLVQAVSRELEQHMSLSMTIAMAISQSELGAGDGGDIYPGLYTQHTLDELQSVCARRPPAVLLSPAVCEDLDIASRLEHRPTDVGGYALIEAFAATYKDLLERQRRLIMTRLTDQG